MREENRNGEIWLDCSRCGKMFKAYDAGTSFASLLAAIYSKDDMRLCQECADADCAEKEAQRIEQEKTDYQNRLADMAIDNGVPRGYIFHRETGKLIEEPLKPEVFNWIWRNRNHNLLLTAKTGEGKSTSACMAAVRLIAEGKHVRYAKLLNLLFEWRNVKKSDDRYALDRFFSTIGFLDVLIIDEAADKTVISESGNEMMFELLDRVYDGELQTKVWITGNFRGGALKELFGDDDPVYRRLEENFIIGGIQDSGAVKRIHVFKDSVRKRHETLS